MFYTDQKCTSFIKFNHNWNVDKDRLGFNQG